MPMVTITVLDDTQHRIEGYIGNSLIEMMQDDGIGDLLAICRGSCSCATRHVFDADVAMLAALPAMLDDETRCWTVAGTGDRPRACRATRR